MIFLALLQVIWIPVVCAMAEMSFQKTHRFLTIGNPFLLAKGVGTLACLGIHFIMGMATMLVMVILRRQHRTRRRSTRVRRRSLVAEEQTHPHIVEVQ